MDAMTNKQIILGILLSAGWIALGWWFFFRKKTPHRVDNVGGGAVASKRMRYADLPDLIDTDSDNDSDYGCGDD